MKSIKNDFPIFKNNKDLVYLDSAATSQKPQIVIDTISDYYNNYNANIHRGLYPIAEKATTAVEQVRQKIAQFINAKNSDEIIFTKSTTEAVNLVSHTWGEENILENDVIITTIMEHHANFVPWQQLAIKKRAKLEVIDIDDNYQLPITNFQSNLNIKKAKILAITSISNVLGTINPLKKIIAEVKTINPNIKILVDAAQAVSHMPVDVRDLNCDFLVFSGHKMFAETGVGIFFGKKELLQNMSPFLFGGNMIREVQKTETIFADLPDKFEAGTLNISGIISLGTAIDYLQNIGFVSIQKYEEELMVYGLERVREIPDLRIFGSNDKEKRIGVIAFTLDGIHPHDVSQILGEQHICVRAGHHCTMPLHERLGIPASTRVSLSIYNTKEDIDRLIQGIELVKKTFQK